MPTLRTVAWLVMMWFVAGLAGFTMCYALTSGLGFLAVLSLLMSLGVLAGSLMPLSAGLSLWDDSKGAGGRRGPVRVPVAFGGSSSASSSPPGATSRARSALSGLAGAFATTSGPAATGPVAVIHEAGAPSGDSQSCSRCGVTLTRDGTFDQAPPPGKTWPPGSWVAVWKNALYPLEQRALQDGEAFCTGGGLSAWGTDPARSTADSA